MCTLCVFESNRKCFYGDKLKREEAMSRPISQHILVSPWFNSLRSHLNTRLSVTLRSFVFFSPTLPGMSVSLSESAHRRRGTDICYRPRPLCKSVLHPFDKLHSMSCLLEELYSPHGLSQSGLSVRLTKGFDMHLQSKDNSAVDGTPMWLDSIAEKLQQQCYQTVGEFVSDVQRIFSKWASHNRVSSLFFNDIITFTCGWWFFYGQVKFKM